MLNRLIPRDEQFFDLFNQLAEHLKTAAALLGELFADPGRTAELVKQIKALDDQLDTLWNEHRAIRARIRFGEREQIVKRARAEERLERAA